MHRTNPCPNDSASQTGEDRLTPILADLRDHQILPRLPYEAMSSLNLVSHAWFEFTNKADGMRFIERDAGIPMKTLTRFIALIKAIHPSMSFSFMTIYHRLHRLLKHPSSDNKMLKDFYLHPTQHLALLACCLNSASDKIIVNFIPYDEVESWLKIAIMCGANQTVKQLIRVFNYDIDKNFINLIAEFGNLGLLQDLKAELDKRLNPDAQTLHHAIRSGNLKLVKYLCEHYPVLDKKLDKHSLIMAARLGNCDVLQFLLDDKNAFDCVPDDDVLVMAVSSSDERTIHYLVDKYGLSVEDVSPIACSKPEMVSLAQDESHQPDQAMLNRAIELGDIDTITELLKQANRYNLSITGESLRLAIISGNVDVLDFLLKREDACHSLQLVEFKLDEALKSGRLEMLDYILRLPREENSFTSHTISRSLQACHSEMMRRFFVYLYQINQSYQFQIKFCDIGNMHLLSADQYFRRAMVSLKSDDIFTAKCALLISSERSRRHFFTLATHTIEHAKEFEIGVKHINCLLNVMNDVLARGIPSLIEREVIGQLFHSATNEQVRAMKDRLQGVELSAACSMAKS